MHFSYEVPFDQPADQVWQVLQDPVRLIRALPGCEAVEPDPSRSGDEPGVQAFRVRLSTGLGPVRLRMEGSARLRWDPENRTVKAEVSLNDARSGAVYGTFVLKAQPVDDFRSRLLLEADVVLGGKIGEFAQPLLRRKADQTVREFAENLRR